MFKEHATIVDTPGVGESEETTNILINYLPEAVAFIYVINTTNAGGVQNDRVRCENTHTYKHTQTHTKRESVCIIGIMYKFIHRFKIINKINVQFRLH